MTSLSSSKTEFTCVFYDVFDVGGFTGLFRGRVLTIFLWDFSHLLILDISINIVLAHVVSFPTNLVSLNSESVCRSCVSFGILKKVVEVLPPMGAVLPLGGDVIFYYRSWERYYRLERYYAATSVATSALDQKLVISPAVVGTDVFF